MFNITSHKELPANLRRAGSYSYLDNELNAYWLHAIDVAHDLITKHEIAHGWETYYQVDFAADFIVALKDNGIAQPAEIMGEISLDYAIRLEDRKSDIAFVWHKEAIEKLKVSPRGTQFLVEIKWAMGDGTHWEVRIHTGGGNISECKTMERYTERPPVAAAVQCMLSYEAYLARSQADKERICLANYARIRELDLQPGLKLRDIEIHFNGKYRKMSFDIQAINSSGSLSLINGKMRGSSSVFNCEKDAMTINSENFPQQAIKSVKEGELVTCCSLF